MLLGVLVVWIVMVCSGILCSLVFLNVCCSIILLFIFVIIVLIWEVVVGLVGDG